MGYYTLLFGKREEVPYELPEENYTAQHTIYCMIAPGNHGNF